MRKKIAGGALHFTDLVLVLATGRNIFSDPDGWIAGVVISLPLLLVVVLSAFLGRRLRSDQPIRLRMGITMGALLVVSLAITTYEIVVAFVDHKLGDRQYAGVFEDCHKVWGARGLVLANSEIVKDGTQNTIESVTLAFDEGATGCEIDVFFDAEMGHFIVSHDRPYHLKNGKLLLLAEMMEAVGQRGYIWLDFKKLRHLDAAALDAAVIELLEITTEFGDKSRMYVEGEDPLNLSAFRDAGFPTILDSHPLADSNYVTPALINLYKVLYYFGGFTVFAMNYGEVDDPIYGKRTKAALGDIPLFVYHVEDDSKVLNDLATSSSVRVILVENQSLNRYDLNGCP